MNRYLVWHILCIAAHPYLSFFPNNCQCKAFMVARAPTAKTGSEELVSRTASRCEAFSSTHIEDGSKDEVGDRWHGDSFKKRGKKDFSSPRKEIV